MVNILSAKALLALYQEITLEQVQEREQHVRKQGLKPDGVLILESLTGFGCTTTCTLCREAKTIAQNWEESKVFCKHCIYNDGWFDDFYCIDITYQAICHATTAKEVYEALQQRIDYLAKVINEYENHNGRVEESDIQCSDSEKLA